MEREIRDSSIVEARSVFGGMKDRERVFECMLCSARTMKRLDIESTVTMVRVSPDVKARSFPVAQMAVAADSSVYWNRRRASIMGKPVFGSVDI